MLSSLNNGYIILFFGRTLFKLTAFADAISEGGWPHPFRYPIIKSRGGVTGEGVSQYAKICFSYTDLKFIVNSSN